MGEGVRTRKATGKNITEKSGNLKKKGKKCGKAPARAKQNGIHVNKNDQTKG